MGFVVNFFIELKILEKLLVIEIINLGKLYCIGFWMN